MSQKDGSLSTRSSGKMSWNSCRRGRTTSEIAEVSKLTVAAFGARWMRFPNSATLSRIVHTTIGWHLYWWKTYVSTILLGTNTIFTPPKWNCKSLCSHHAPPSDHTTKASRKIGDTHSQALYHTTLYPCTSCWLRSRLRTTWKLSTHPHLYSVGCRSIVILRICTVS